MVKFQLGDFGTYEGITGKVIRRDLVYIDLELPEEGQDFSVQEGMLEKATETEIKLWKKEAFVKRL